MGLHINKNLMMCKRRVRINLCYKSKNQNEGQSQFMITLTKDNLIFTFGKHSLIKLVTPSEHDRECPSLIVSWFFKQGNDPHTFILATLHNSYIAT